ncbi:MAG: transglycosylase SLT domain-containing protein [Bryobacteraceae bacterium]
MSSRPQQFASSFLPSVPSSRASDAGEPPRIEPNLYSNEFPKPLPPMLPDPALAQSATDKRVQTAEEQFQAGKRFYQAGDAEGARHAFDAAIEVLMTAPAGLADRHKIEHKLDQLVDSIYKYDLDRLAAGGPGDGVVFQKPPLDDILEMTFTTDPRLKPKVGEELQATISQLPLDASDAVLSYIHYFSTDRGRRTLLSGLRRGERYRAMVSRILDEEGVPRELFYLAQAESGFIPYAVSYKRASGMWQFMQFRGREYGLSQTQWSDDRFDPEKSTRAAAKHLRDLYTELGDWYLAMAAYNCGPGCVEKAVTHTGYADFWELCAKNALPRQTQNYVPLILAITIMAKNPRDYGLENLDGEQPIEYDTVAISAPTNLWLVSDVADRALAEIRELNPSLIKSLAPAGYQLRVPRGTAPAVTAALEQVPVDRRASWRMHRVADGETLASIARRFNMAATTIASANHISVEAPATGDLLLIPASSAVGQAPARPGVRYAQGHRRAHAAVARNVSPRVLQHRASKRQPRIASAARHRR